MPINTKFNIENNTLLIGVSGEFDSSCYEDFRKVMQEITPLMKSIVVNLRDTEYMSISSLGMLLILRECTINNGQDLQIVEANSFIKKILYEANFGLLLSIKYRSLSDIKQLKLCI